MAKLSWLSEILLGIVLPKALEVGGDEVTKLLEKAYADNPELVKTVLVSLYPFVDVYVEKFAAESKTKLDDAAVAEIMEVIESFAVLHEITLPNIDND